MKLDIYTLLICYLLKNKKNIMNVNLKKLYELSTKTANDTGVSENNVKYKFIIPFLECFGYKDKEIDFEHAAQGNRIDIFIQSDYGIVIETKAYNINLDQHIDKLKIYCDAKRPVLAIIANGEEIRFYSPFWRSKKDFRDTIIYSIKRSDLTNNDTVNRLEKIISKDNLYNGLIDENIQEREKELNDFTKNYHKIKEEFKDKEQIIINQISSLNIQITEFEKQRNDIIKLEKDELTKLENKYLIPKLQINYCTDIKSTQQTKNEIEDSTENITLTLKGEKESWRKYNLIRFPNDKRKFFPKFKVLFILETDVGEIKTKVTSKMGDDKDNIWAGYYIAGGLKKFYEAHKELKNGDKLRISRISDNKYRLDLIK